MTGMVRQVNAGKLQKLQRKGDTHLSAQLGRNQPKPIDMADTLGCWAWLADPLPTAYSSPNSAPRPAGPCCARPPQLLSCRPGFVAVTAPSACLSIHRDPGLEGQAARASERRRGASLARLSVSICLPHASAAPYRGVRSVCQRLPPARLGQLLIL